MSLKTELKRGILITFISKYSNIFFELIIGAVLARLLSPKEFGIVAVILVFTTFFNLLSDIGIGTAIIQNKTLNKVHLQSIFNYTLLIGITTGALFAFTSYPIAEFYNNNEYVRIGQLLSFAILFYTIDIVPQAILRKNKKFLKLEGAIVLINITTGIFAIYQANNGYSYYALINRAILKSGLLFIVNYYNSKFKYGSSFETEGIRLIYKYSSFQFLFNFINYFSRNLDNILIGKYMGSASLGFYDRAYRLMMYPVQSLTHVITPVLHPILSEYQDKPEIIYNNYKNILEFLAFLGIPLSVFLYYTTEEIIYIMYGEQWKNSIPVFKVLALTIWIQMTLSSTGSIFQALGKTNLLFYSGLISAVFMVTGILCGVLSKDLEIVGYGLLIAFSLNLLQGFYFLFVIGFKKPIFHFLRFFKVGFISGLLLFIFFNFIKHIDINIFVSLFLKSLFLLLSLFLGALVTGKKYFDFLLKKRK
ncbi:lipopolysaccharide biosynthesis protein [Arenibacter palladensis]|uniref:lipopolysaccharide biosynthesis protein n=1 Tax=Arenibacter palladensis TaxID=237373 RepID=UPI002FD4F058